MVKSDSVYFQDSWDVIVARNIEEIETIRPLWEEMQAKESHPVINADIDRYISVIKASGGDAQPYIILMKQNGHPAAMVIGRVEKHTVKLRLGYKTLLSPTLRCLTVVYGGVLGQPKSDLCSLLIGELLKELQRGEAEMIYFNHLRIDCQLYQFARKMPGILGRDYFSKIEPHWTMSVPREMEVFYNSCGKSSRKQFKKCIKRIEKEFPGQLRRVSYTREDQLDEAIRIAAQISSKTYQRALGSGFVDDARTRTLFATAARKGWLRLYVLFIDDEACAFELWLQYGNVYFGHGIGFDPKWRRWRIGTVLFLQTIEQLANDREVDTIDFGFGDAEYKRSYGNEHWNEASVYIFAPRLYPIFVNLVRTLMMGLSIAVEFIIKRFGFLGWVKRQWRNVLQKG